MPENGGAANPRFNRDALEEQRGSCHEDADPMAKVSPIAHLQKKTKVPLSGITQS